MSSVLNRGKKKQKFYTTKECNTFDRNGKPEMRNANLIAETHKHLKYIGYMTLRDRYGFGERRIKRFSANVEGMFEKYRRGEITSLDMLRYCESKGLDVSSWIRDVGQHQKLNFSNYKKYNANAMMAIKLIDAAFVSYAMIVAVILKEIFRFSNNQISGFWEHMKYYIDSYVRDYLTDDIINEIMVDECSFDISKDIFV